MSVPFVRLRPSMDGLETVSDPKLAKLNTIPNFPGQPGYKAKLPKPDGPGIGEEPLDLDMAKLAETDGETHDKILGLLAQSPYPSSSDETATRTPPQIANGVVAQRAAIYCGRGESFVLMMETPPDWEPSEQWKYTDVSALIRMMDVLKAFGVRVIDRTGGELNELREHAPSRTEAAPSAGTSATSEGKPAERAPAAKRGGGRKDR